MKVDTQVKVEPSVEPNNDVKLEPNNDSVKVEPGQATFDPLRLMCTICGKLCRLGSRLRCCLVNACDTCAKKTVAETSKCWTCGEIAYLDHVSKDEELRKRVLEWRNDLSTQVFHLRRGSQPGGEHGLLLGPSL